MAAAEGLQEVPEGKDYSFPAEARRRRAPSVPARPPPLTRRGRRR